MKCKNCIHFKYKSENDFKCCSIWTDYYMNKSGLPIDKGCQGCADHPPITMNEFVTNTRRYNLKNYGMGKVKLGENWYFGGIIVAENNRCDFYKKRR